MDGYVFTQKAKLFLAKVKDTDKYKNVDFDNLDYTDYFKLIESKANLTEIRNSEEYKDADFWYFETTSSCNKKEAIRWLKYYMACAIAYGVTEKKFDWAHKFVAAYDILNELCK